MIARRLALVALLAFFFLAGCTPRGAFDSRADEELNIENLARGWIAEALPEVEDVEVQSTIDQCPPTDQRWSHMEIWFDHPDPDAARETLVAYLVDVIHGKNETPDSYTPHSSYVVVDGRGWGISAFGEGLLLGHGERVQLGASTGCYDE